MHHLIDPICRDPRAHLPRRNVQHLSRQPAHLAHALDGFGVQDGDPGARADGLLGARHAARVVVGQPDVLGHGAARRQRVHGAERAREGEGREGVVVACLGVRRGHDRGREEVLEQRGLCLVDLFVLALVRVLVIAGRVRGGGEGAFRRGRGRKCVKPTQFFLKQSCEQKKLSLPSFWHVGHWSCPASLLHPALWHCRFGAGSDFEPEVMMSDAREKGHRTAQAQGGIRGDVICDEEVVRRVRCLFGV